MRHSPAHQGGPRSLGEKEERHRGAPERTGAQRHCQGAASCLRDLGTSTEHLQEALQECHEGNNLSYVKMITHVWMGCCTADAGYGTQGQCRPQAICSSTGQENFVQMVMYKQVKSAAAEAERINMQPLLLPSSPPFFILPLPSLLFLLLLLFP